MIKRLLSADPFTGIKTWWYEDVLGNVTVEDEQDITDDFMSENRAQYNAHSDYGPSRWKGTFHHVAEIPGIIYERLAREGILDDQKALHKWLNDPDNRVFRVKPGRI